MKTELSKVWWVIVIAIIIIVGAVVLRGFTGEDNWICQDGQWQKHGNPSSGMPATSCEIK